MHFLDGHTMKNKALLQVFIAIILAILAGWMTGPDEELFGVPYLQYYSLIGQLFLNALTLVVVPLVCASIVTGAARMGTEHSFGSLGTKTLGYFALSLFLAVGIGLFCATLISPGSFQELTAALPQEPHIVKMTEQLESSAFSKIEQIILKIIPSNIIAVASQGQMLGLILFSLLFGYFITKIDEKPGAIVLGLFQGIFQIMMKITHLIMKALPIGVFGLVAKVVATTGLESFASVALYFMTVLSGFLIFGLIAMPLLLKLVAKVSPLAHLKAMAPALFTAFTTSSSVATLPLSIECLEKRAGVSNRVTAFVMPLGVSLNMSGTALFQAVSALFIAQVYEIELSASLIILVGVMSFLTSIGVAGIPSASLISLVITLSTAGLPTDGIGLIMAVERILDMFRTTANVYGNVSCAVLIARAEGEQNIYTNQMKGVETSE